MKLDPPISCDAGAGLSLIVRTAWTDKQGAVVAEIQVWNGNLIFTDTVKTGKASQRTRLAQTLKSLVTIDEISLHKAILQIEGNLADMLAAEPKAILETQKTSRNTTSNALVELAADGFYFHTPDGEAFATITIRDHKETWPLKSNAFKGWLQRAYYKSTGSVPNIQAVQNAIALLDAKSHVEDSVERVYTRLAEYNDRIYVDLANDSWECVEITRSGWTIVAEAPVKFRRAKGMQALPIPTKGRSLLELRSFVNIGKDQDWTLLCAWLVQALRPRGPYPIGIVQGEQGSAKSMLVRVLRALIDPSECPLRAVPRSEHDLVIAARNGWCLAFDNLSSISPWLSDAFCRLATGGGFATRQLYSDSEEVLFDAQRPVLLNGIDDLATRSDLLDRAIIYGLPYISPESRRSEKQMWADFEAARPGILGGLYDSVATALREVGSISLDRLPRMADFAIWASAAESSFGERGRFIEAYDSNRTSANAVALDSSPIARPILLLTKRERKYSGTATEVLRDINAIAGEEVISKREWPKNPRALSNRLRRLAPNLRASGITVEFEREGPAGTKMIRLELDREFASASPSTQELQNPTTGYDGAVPTQIHLTGPDRETARVKTTHPLETNAFGVADGGQADANTYADAKLHTCSNDPKNQSEDWEVL